MRIAKFIAHQGFCSRRDAEKLLFAGKISLNGEICENPATKVNEKDEIIINGEPLKLQEKPRLWLFHKPKNTITTHKDPQNRTTIFSLLPKDFPHVISIGRLDFTSEGLILLTNSPKLKSFLEDPKTGWKRKYLVRAFGKFDEKKFASLAKGTTIEGIKYKPFEFSYEKQQKSNNWLTIILREGKNREIRNICEAADLTVNRLIRTSFGSFELGDLKVSHLKEIPYKIIKEQCGNF